MPTPAEWELLRYRRPDERPERPTLSRIGGKSAPGGSPRWLAIARLLAHVKRWQYDKRSTPRRLEISSDDTWGPRHRPDLPATDGQEAAASISLNAWGVFEGGSTLAADDQGGSRKIPLRSIGAHTAPTSVLEGSIVETAKYHDHHEECLLNNPPQPAPEPGWRRWTPAPEYRWRWKLPLPCQRFYNDETTATSSTIPAMRVPRGAVI